VTLAAVSSSGVPVPSWTGVAVSLVLVGVAAAVILRERLRLSRELLIAAARAAVQLVAVGYVLKLLFTHTGIPGSLGWVAGMVVVAGRVGARRGRGLPHAQLLSTAAVATAVTATLGLLVGAGVVASQPRVVVPIGGMVVNAAMTGTSVTMLRLREEVERGRREVEARLALGLTGAQAFAPNVRSALRTALAPQIDSTSTVGLIALPGAMTGLIIAGLSPLLAIRYQIVVMYQVLGSAAIAGVVVAKLSQRLLFDDAHRLRRIAVSGGATRRSRTASRWRRETRPSMRVRGPRRPRARQR
jgi:putative ABC transport system permease protein